MSDAIIAGLIVAFVTGLTVFAIKYPKTYDSYYKTFILTWIGFGILYASWKSGIRLTLNTLKESGLISEFDFPRFEKTINDASDLPIWVVLVYFGFYAYIYFLSNLTDKMRANKELPE